MADLSLPRTSIGSDADFDDGLAISDSIKVVDIGDGPVAIENGDDESNGNEPNLKIVYCANFDV